MLTNVATVSTAQPVQTMTRVRRIRRPNGWIASTNTTPPMSSARHANTSPRPTAYSTPTVVLPPCSESRRGGKPSGVPGGRFGADLERERALDRMRVGRRDAPRDDVGAVLEVGQRRLHLGSAPVGMLRRAGIDPIPVAVEHADTAERDLDRLVEPQGDRRRCVVVDPAGLRVDGDQRRVRARGQRGRREHGERDRGEGG